MSSELFDKGLANRKKVLGTAYVERAIDGADAFNRDFQSLLTEYCWGAIWGSDGISHKQKSLNNLCMTAALGRSHEFELHFKGAMRNGCTLAELRDTLMQIGVYCGMPAAVESFRIARKVFAEEGIDPDKDESLS